MTGLDQLAIAIFGVSAIWLSNDRREKLRRWGPICGLLAQPAWLYTTYVHGQWVIFALTLFYTLGWCKGVRTYWMKGAA